MKYSELYRLHSLSTVRWIPRTGAMYFQGKVGIAALEISFTNFVSGQKDKLYNGRNIGIYLFKENFFVLDKGEKNKYWDFEDHLSLTWEREWLLNGKPCLRFPDRTCLRQRVFDNQNRICQSLSSSGSCTCTLQLDGVGWEKRLTLGSRCHWSARSMEAGRSQINHHFAMHVFGFVYIRAQSHASWFIATALVYLQVNQKVSRYRIIWYGMFFRNLTRWLL